jgi:uncharacterized protein (TIGR02757 family)
MIRDVKSFLDQKYKQYGGHLFIANDPVQIPHRYIKKQDVEIAGFLTAILAWGQRKTIINNANRLLQWMDHAPHDFMLTHQPDDLKPFNQFVHRTFNGDDCHFFIKRLSEIYRHHNSLEDFFLTTGNGNTSVKELLSGFKRNFFMPPHLPRTEKHLADPMKNATAKRLNMFLRWMVRHDVYSIDFGVWSRLSPALLMCPLDVHSGNVARKLNLLKRKQNDWKAVEELTGNLRRFEESDPVRYDIPLFALGAVEDF